MTTKRYELLQAVIERLKLLPLKDVYQQRGTLDDEVRNNLPVAAVVELPEQPEVLRRDGRDHREHQQIVFIVQGWVAMDEAATTEPAYALLAEFQRVLRPLETQRPPNTVQVRVAPGYVTVPQQAARTCSCVVEITIHFVDMLGEPYADRK